MSELDLSRLTDDERAELDRLIATPEPWTPLPGPQTMAYESEADVVGYGGAAGGGKTHLAIGLSLTRHKRIAIFRQNGTELTAINDDIAAIVGSRDSYNGSDKIWRMPRFDGVPMQIELGSFPAPGMEARYRGRPHDLLVFDEASEMREIAVKFLMGWLRTTDQNQRCRALLCFNPPTSVEGRWIIGYFAPWLDKKHPNPAQPGELRWFATKDGVELEVDDSSPFDHDGETITPTSRTFVPSRITDNPYLLGTGYLRQLQSMPEPLRSQLLYGDFHAGVEDDPWQVVPTSWVEAAMARWTPQVKLPVMDSIGVDVAMRGADNTVLARRHGMWFDKPIVYRGDQCPDGATIAGYVVAAVRDKAVIHIDLFGVGAQPFGHLMGVGQQVIGCNVGEPARGIAKDGRVQFRNWRSELWWRMREALDPNANTGICLPPDKNLLNDLCTPKWKLTGSAIQVQGRQEIMDKLGKSPDYASAYILGLLDTPKRSAMLALGAAGRKSREYDPYSDI
tara:strand:+ start:407 stop:1927 length:1521 start_codon:yes stop_codon:yes gene_type:complete